MLARIGERAEGWIALTNGIVGEGRALYRAMVDDSSQPALHNAKSNYAGLAGVFFKEG